MMKILIIGGGIGGLAAGVALQRKGLDAQVYESASAVRPVGAGIWVPTNAMLALVRLGLSHAVETAGVSLESVEVHDKKDGRLMRLDLRQVEQQHGQTTVSIHRAALHQILLDHVRPGTFHTGKRCAGFTQTPDGVTVQFQDGTQVEGDILVGADGIHSIIRQTLFPDVALRYSGQTCYRGIATLELPPDLERTCREVWGGDSRFGFSAIGQQQIYWFAPVTSAAGGAEILPEVLAKRYADFPSPIPDIIAHSLAGDIIRTDLYDFLPLKRWWQGRVMLLGDAAHAMTPNLGQGGAQAIEDAFFLAQTLSDRESTNAAFEEFERFRMPRVRRIGHTAWQFGQIAHIRNRWAQKIRNVAMKSVPDQMNQKQVDWLYALNG